MLFFFNDTATTEIYTLSLHDALPILAKTTDDFALLNLRGSLALLGQGDDLAEVLMAIGAGRDMLPAGESRGVGRKDAVLVRSLRRRRHDTIGRKEIGRASCRERV